MWLCRTTIHTLRSRAAITFDNDDVGKAATYDPPFRLMLKLVSFDTKPTTDESEQLFWYVPRSVMPESLEASARIIEQFLREPFDLDGEDAADMLRRKRKKPVRRRRSPSVASDGEVRSNRPGKQAEVQQYKSAAFIEDSDEDEERDRAFFAKEAERRARYRTPTSTAPAHRPAGTRKRAKIAGTAADTTQHPISSSIRRSSPVQGSETESERDSAVGASPDSNISASPKPPATSTNRARPRARPRRKFDPDLETEESMAERTEPGLDATVDSQTGIIPRKRRVVHESDEEDG